MPELLIPAGNFSKLRIALAYGADAVYVGAKGMSMRPDEASFTPSALAKAVKYVHSHNRKIYVGINTMMFQEDLEPLKQWLIETKNLSLDAVIVSDTGVFTLIKELRPELNIHISTQMNTSNTISAGFWKKAGAKRIVLARECTLAHAKEIAEKSGLEIEIFVHGSMCMAISGRCILSAHLCGQSASRGKCKHSCRWEWQLVEQKRPGKTMPVFETGRETIFLGSTDLCLIQHIPLLIESRIDSLKIEGRMKSESYVATVTRVYRAALDSYAQNPDKYKVDPEWINELEEVSHRPYGVGFAFGYPSSRTAPSKAWDGEKPAQKRKQMGLPSSNPESLQTHNRPVNTCEILGVVNSVSEKKHTLSVKNPFKAGETIEWIGPKMAGGIIKASNFYDLEGKQLSKIQSGTTITVSFSNGVVLPEYAILRRRKS